MTRPAKPVAHRQACLAAAALAIAAATVEAAASGAAAPAAEPLVRLAGRSHILLIHFPIVLLILAAAVEFPARVARRPRLAHASVVLVCLGAVSGALTAWLGWIYAEVEPPGSSKAELLSIHRWTGVATAIIAALAATASVIAALLPRRPLVGLAFTGMALASASVVVSAHFGGSLVHGERFLIGVFDPAPEPPNPTPGQAPGQTPERPEDPLVDATLVAFERDVLPIFESSCVECHGRRKAKAGLRLDSVPALAAGSISGPVVVAGDPGVSELVARVKLEPWDPDVMPPDGDPLTPDQIALLEGWILAMTAAALDRVTDAGPDPAPASPTPAADDRQDPARLAPVAPAPAVLARAVSALRNAGASVGPLAASDRALVVNLGVARAWTPDLLRHVDALGAAVVELNLSRTPVTTGDLATLGEMPNLRVLDLRATPVAALGPMPVLRHVQRLNLAETRVDDDAIDHLIGLDALERVYVWASGITAAGTGRLASARPDLLVETGGSLPADDAAPTDATTTNATTTEGTTTKGTTATGTDTRTGGA